MNSNKTHFPVDPSNNRFRIYGKENYIQPYRITTDDEIFAAATLLYTTIYVYGPVSKAEYGWQNYSPKFDTGVFNRTREAIYLVNYGGYYYEPLFIKTD